MLQVIVFALIVGVILAKLQDKTQLVTNFFQQGNDIMMEMTMMVMGLAPIGVFCLISKTFAGLGFSAMVPMFKYMGAVLLALFIQCCGVYQILLALLTRLNPLRFLKKFAPVMGFAFSTATSNATIPMNIDTLEEKSASTAVFRPSPSRSARPSIWMVRPSCRVLPLYSLHRRSASS